jgi:hypothetical protein
VSGGRLLLDAIARDHARRAGPWWRSWGAALVLGLVLAPVGERVIGPALAGVGEPWPILSALWLRLGVVLLTAAALRANDVVLRSPTRAALELLPVRADLLVVAELREAGRVGGRWVLVVWLAALPVAWHVSVEAWIYGLATLMLASTFGLVAGAASLLGAVGAAESPAWAGLLDAVRGNNPRPQAALIWAMAPVAAGGATLIAGAAEGSARLAAGEVGGAAWLLGFALVGAALRTLAVRLAPRWWFVASVVLAEIRARYAAVETAEEARRVPMEHWVAWAPARVAPWLRLELRAGFRAHRSWLSAAWLGVLAAAFTVWTPDRSAPWRAGVWLGAAAWCASMAAVRGALDEQGFLTAWLGGGGERRAARALAVIAWWTPLLLVGLLPGLRHGLAGVAAMAASGAAVAGLGALSTAVAAGGGPRAAALHAAAGVGVALLLSAALGGLG